VAELALYAIGRDRPGIVAAIAGALLEHEVNIEDSQATILRGHFAMVLILRAPEEADSEALLGDLTRAAEETELDWIYVNEVEDTAEQPPEPSHILSVYGGDHPGIVHAVSSSLAERGVGITDLNSRVIAGDDGDEPLYVLMLELALPDDVEEEELRSALAGVAESEGVEVTLRELEQDEL
jgi:glycine cleavage system transcriptional repressor